LTEPSTKSDPRIPQIEAALREYLERLDRGEQFDVEGFLARHGEIADSLRSFIASEIDLRQLAQLAAIDVTHVQSTRSMTLRGQETFVPASTPSDASAPEGLLSGDFGRYRIIKTLGKGAMGIVYLAEDTQLTRQVAIKTPHFKTVPSAESIERFYREARAAATLRSPHICPVFDVGQINGTHYLSMQYIDGRPLSDFVSSHKFQNERHILIAIRKLALALQDAHQQKIVHRDLKPANIMVDRKGEPIIMDFGLARQVGRDDEARLTESGLVVGTPAFMSPEQIEGISEKIGPPTDQYSLGVVFYELLTGQLPFRGTLLAVMAQVMTQQPVPPSRLRTDLDPRVESVCLKMMAKKSRDRFTSMLAVAEELETILRNPLVKEETAKAPAPLAPAVADALPRASDPVAKTVILPKVASAAAPSPKGNRYAGANLPVLEKAARQLMTRGHCEKVIDLIEGVAENDRTQGLQTLYADACRRREEIALLTRQLDEAVRSGDGSAAARHAEHLLKLKPDHPRALEICGRKSAGREPSHEPGRPRQRLRELWSRNRWFRWMVPVAGAAAVIILLGVCLLSLRSSKAVLKIAIDDPNVEVYVEGSTLAVKAPGGEIEVEPGPIELTVSDGISQFTTKSFSVARRDRKSVTVSVVDSNLTATMGGTVLGVESDEPADDTPKETPTVTAQETPTATAKETSEVSPAIVLPSKAPPASTPPVVAKPIHSQAPIIDRHALVIRGRWHIEGDEIVKPRHKGPFSIIHFGNSEWTDYDFSVELMREDGKHCCGLCYRAVDAHNQYRFIIAGWSRQKVPKAGINVESSGIPTYGGPRHSCVLRNKEWYIASIKVRGDRSEAYLDGELMYTNLDDKHSKGQVGLFAYEPGFHFRNIKVTAPDGRSLWEGNPELR
jgi:tRNA A-37 threonylcarbamoyl transferase component Bud32